MTWKVWLEKAGLAALGAAAAFGVQHAADLPGRCGCGPAMGAVFALVLDVVHKWQKSLGVEETK